MSKTLLDMPRTEPAPAEAQAAPPRRPKQGRGAAYRLKVALREPTTIVGILALALFTYLIVVPILSMLNDAVLVQYGDESRSGQNFGELTAYYFQRVFASPLSATIFWRPLGNTLMIAVGAIVFAVLIGGTMAWLLSRTNMWGRRWFATALIVPYMLPAWTFALAWTNLFKNRKIGGQPGWLESMGMEPPDWLSYGQVPIMVVLALHYTPFVILLFGNALRRFDSQLEDSARVLGARRFTVTMRVILPLMRPSLISAIILIFAKCLGEFGVAYVLGMPVQFEVLSTSLYRSISSRQTGVAAVLAGAIILIGVISLLVDARLVREGKRFVTVGSKGSMNRLSDLGRWRGVATLGAGAVFAISVAIPLLTLFLSTVMRLPGDFSPSNFTLDYWIGHDLKTVALPQGVLLTPEFWAAAWNTLWIVGLAAITSGVLGLLVGYIVVRTPVKFVGGALRQITFFPYLVPGIAFAVAYLSLFAVQRGPVPALYGTAAILVLAFIAEQMPYASRAGISAMMQLGKDPEEAAQVAGAGWWTRMTRIVIPIQKGSLATGVLLPFISGVKGLSLVVILAVPGTNVLTTYSLQLVDYGYQQAANVVVLMVAAVAFFGTLFGQKLTKSNLAEGLGG
ncbi:Sulfate transport system permease protein CysW [Microbacterium hydrocarbonoxydans]|uniref:Sulfate transport system permease protein CysW n=1 Tax=Microbacterium hydrocarbonoxydans TaxID=273678 RepID=A0A0M2HV03_9MICO|nr:iron ABC transporter permease [Microbacterium hydrocarbonoxydans]KJL48730.1 Sulfate transport system permease protein CysW [Microbacterium hydrocarbonoxydans]